MMRVACVLAAGLFASCVTGAAARDRGAAGLFERAAVIQAPATDRCEALSTPKVRAACAEERATAQRYVKKLSPGDQVCLLQGFGEPSLTGCPARAAVVDLGSNQLLLEIRDAAPDTSWFQKIQQQFWFDEGALVDFYLRDHGY